MTTKKKIDTPSGLPFSYVGPGLDKGPLPALLYFALTGEESLELEPFNHPVLLLKEFPVHIFSATIPGHGDHLKHTEAMARWKTQIVEGIDPMTPFFEQCLHNLDFLIDQKIVDPQKIAAAGISRGAFIATHLAARDSKISIVLGYAPLTTFKTIHEFESYLDLPLVQNLELNTQGLIGKKIRYYMGNRDTRVGTDECFQFIRKVTEESYAQGIRSPDAELIIYPSIGHKGHGTPPHIFEDGVNWLKSALFGK